jgi:hypothetical protein
MKHFVRYIYFKALIRKISLLYHIYYYILQNSFQRIVTVSAILLDITWDRRCGGDYSSGFASVMKETIEQLEYLLQESGSISEIEEKIFCLI